MNLLRSLLAFFVPNLVGIILLLACMPFGRRRALAVALPVITFLGTRLAGFRLKVEDPFDSLKKRPAVFVINHQSGIDPLIAAAVLKKNIIGVTKVQLRRHPLLGPLLRLAGTVFVDREQHPGPQALTHAIHSLEHGYGIVLAPEGHRSRDGTLGKFRPGAIWLAQQARVPLIPIVIHNSADILPANRLLLRPGTVYIDVLATQDPATLDPERLYALFAHQLAGRTA